MVKRTTLQKFWDIVNEHRGDVSAIYLYAIMYGLLQLVVPVGVQAIIGFVLGGAMVTSLYILICMVVLSVVVVGMLQIKQMKIIERIKQRIFAKYAFLFVEKIPRLDLYKSDSYYLPEKTNNFFDTLNLEKGFSKMLLDIPTAAIQVIFGLIILPLYHPYFIAFVFILAIFLWIVIYFTSRSGLDSSIDESTYKYKFVAWLQDVAKASRFFKLNQNEPLAVKKTDNYVVDYLNSRTSHFRVLLFQYRSLIIFKTAITAVLLGVGVYLLVAQKINIGEFIASEIIILMIIASVDKLIRNMDTIYDVLTAIEKITLVTDLPEEQNGTLLYESPSMEISLTDFSFAYPHSSPTLKNLEFHLPAGKTMCISGGENAGRSTLLRLLSTQYLNFQGQFLVNYMPINNYELASLRKKVGVYYQNVEIFPGTVLENITMGRADIPSTRVIEISHKLGFKSFPHNMPMGLETLLDISGKKLTTNLGRKIGLIRAFIHQPQLVLLDDPWLSLEHKYHVPIMDFLLSQHPTMSVIIATNDLEFAKRCDYHYHLQNGKLIQQL